MSLHVHSPAPVRMFLKMAYCYKCRRVRLHSVKVYEWYDPSWCCLACKKAVVHLTRRHGTWCGQPLSVRRTRDVLRATCKKCRAYRRATYMKPSQERP